MNKRHLLLLIIVFVSMNYLSAQKSVKTEGSAQIEWLRTMSRNDAENEAREKATINALERAFGTVVVQGNSTYISNSNTGEKVETNTTFNMIANTSVKGEVVEVLDVKYTDIKGSKKIDGKTEEITEILCSISITAKEIEEIPVDFVSYPLSCNKKTCKATTFMNNGDFYMYFKSPMSGYVSIYLDITGETQRILPYMEMPQNYEGGFPVKADKEYVFFSTAPEHDYKNKDEYFQVDEYQLVAENEMDINRLFVIFSKEPVNKPKLNTRNEELENIFLTETEKQKGMKLPHSLSSEDFQKWLNKNRSYRKQDMQVEIIDITIRKN